MRLFRLGILLFQGTSLLVSASVRHMGPPRISRFRTSTRASYLDKNKAKEIRQSFLDEAYRYIDYAYPDTALPLNNGSYMDDKTGWKLPLLEGLTTAIIMREHKLVSRMTEFAATCIFYETRKWNLEVSVAEATSHALGPLLSIFDLLSGPYHRPPSTERFLPVFIDQAESLARALMVAFDTPSGLPDPVVTIYPENKRSGAENTTLHDLGSLFLEWIRLTDISGTTDFAAKMETMGQRLLHPIPRESQPFEGLFSNRVNLSDGYFIGDQGGWNDEGLAFYDYYIKLWMYDPVRYSVYKDWWIKAADSVFNNLQSQPASEYPLYFLQDFVGNITMKNSSRPACAVASSFITGGMALEREKYVQFGLQLADTCWSIYRTPKVWPDSPGTISAIELIDVIYDAYRATDDLKWVDRSWELFQHLNALRGIKGGTRFGKHDLVYDFAERMQFTPDNPIFESANWMGRMLRTLWLMVAGTYDYVQQRRVGDTTIGKGNTYIYTTNRNFIQVYGGRDLNELVYWNERVKLDAEQDDHPGRYLDFKYLDEMRNTWRPESWEDFFEAIQDEKN